MGGGEDARRDEAWQWATANALAADSRLDPRFGNIDAVRFSLLNTDNISSIQKYIGLPLQRLGLVHIVHQEQQKILTPHPLRLETSGLRAECHAIHSSLQLPDAVLQIPNALPRARVGSRGELLLDLDVEDAAAPREGRDGRVRRALDRKLNPGEHDYPSESMPEKHSTFKLTLDRGAVSREPDISDREICAALRSDPPIVE